MLYIPKICDHSKILADNKVKDFVVKNLGEYFISTKEKLYSKICEEQNIRKIAESLYIFLTKPDEVEKFANMMWSNISDNCEHHYNIEVWNLVDSELQLNNTKPLIKNKLKELLRELKKFQFQPILVLEYKKINDRKIFHWRTKLIASDSGIDKAFKSMYQGIMKTELLLKQL